MNYVRNMERGVRQPQADKLTKLMTALGASPEQHALARRLAGIDPDPGASPEAKKARREAWRTLFYVLINHVQLPRSTVDDLLDAPALAEWTRRALAARHLAEFHARTASEAPPRQLLAIVDTSFKTLSVPSISAVETRISLRKAMLDAVSRVANHPGASELGTPEELRDLVDSLRSIDHSSLVELTLPLAIEPISAGRALVDIDTRHFDRNFAVAFFPILYWNVCRFWPFEKAALPLARMSLAQQRTLHAAVTDGLSLVEFDLALLGRGPLGERLLRDGTARPSFEELSPDSGNAGLVRFDLHTEPRDALPSSQPLRYFGLPPAVDALSDHLDRCELLARFPFIAIDAGYFEMCGRLESWNTWLADVAANAPDADHTKPPFGDRRFSSVVSPLDTFGSYAEDRAAGSASLHRIADHLRSCAWLKLHEGRWAEVAAAAETLGARPEWRRILAAWSNSRGDPEGAKRE